MTISIHHATMKKALGAGVTLTINGDRIIAVDSQNPDAEFSGINAAELLASVLAKREPVEAKPKTEKAAKPKPVVKKPRRAKLADDDGEAKSANVFSAKYYERYKANGGSNGDAFAEAFAAACKNNKGTVDLDALRQIATANGVEYKWAHLNPGMQRMNLSNVLRGRVRRGEAVTVGKQKFKGAAR